MNLSKTQIAFRLLLSFWVTAEICFSKKPWGVTLSLATLAAAGTAYWDLHLPYFILSTGIMLLLIALIILLHLLKEKKRISREKEEQQRFFSNLIHEVIKGEAQAILADVSPDNTFREQLCEFIKTCELGQTFVDQDNNDLFDLMKGMEFIYSNRLHSEIYERYFYCEIDPSLKGIQLSYRQKYELIFLLRECLNNIRKYSRYKHSGLKISYEKAFSSDRTGRAVLLEIKDDGIGLQNTLSILEPEIEINALNLPGFYERYLSARRCTGIVEIFRKAARMNGCLTLRTSQGGGTSIQLRFFPNSG